jgi:hypothetical protein
VEIFLNNVSMEVTRMNMNTKENGGRKMEVLGV